MGLETFYGTAATEFPNKGTLPLGPAYTRYYWSQFEPSEGNFSFTQMVNDYNAAQAQGQDYCIRIMPYDESHSGPGWLQAMGVSGYNSNSGWFDSVGSQHGRSDGQGRVPEAGPGLGRRFDRLPGFGPIDIGSVGLWGEWHIWATSIIS